jgi:ribosomal-protein-alanine N-acetyltransferase
MPNNSLIVPAKKGDLPEVLEIEEACFKDPWPRLAFLSELAHPWSVFNLIGPLCVKGTATRPIDRAYGFIVSWLLPFELHVLNLGVLPEHRGQGLARKMLRDSIGCFRGHGGGVVSLEVRPSNLSARGLYDSMGFYEVGLRKRYYRLDDEDAIVMVCNIEQDKSG